MSTHAHNIGNVGWPFDTPDNTAIYVCEHVFSDESPILSVFHELDNDWQFICDKDHGNDLPKVVCLGCTVEKDQSLLELATLPMGWLAARPSLKDAWVREQIPGSDATDSNDA